jgi:hypothetical protein
LEVKNHDLEARLKTANKKPQPVVENNALFECSAKREIENPEEKETAAEEISNAEAEANEKVAENPEIKPTPNSPLAEAELTETPNLLSSSDAKQNREATEAKPQDVVDSTPNPPASPSEIPAKARIHAKAQLTPPLSSSKANRKVNASHPLDVVVLRNEMRKQLKKMWEIQEEAVFVEIPLENPEEKIKDTEEKSTPLPSSKVVENQENLAIENSEENEEAEVANEEVAESSLDKISPNPSFPKRGDVKNTAEEIAQPVVAETPTVENPAATIETPTPEVVVADVVEEKPQPVLEAAQPQEVVEETK